MAVNGLITLPKFEMPFIDRSTIDMWGKGPQQLSKPTPMIPGCPDVFCRPCPIKLTIFCSQTDYDLH